MKKIRSLVKKASSPAPPEEIGKLKGKLEKCRNPALTDERLLVFVDDDDDTISVPVETVAAFGNEFDALDFWNVDSRKNKSSIFQLPKSK